MNERHPFAQMIGGYFRQIGCTPAMIDEFRNNFEVTNYNFYTAIGGFTELRKVTAEAVKAQLSIMDYTEKNGFRYLRGKCGPPEWAVVVEGILASAGISIGAWIILVIIFVLLGLLIIICLAASSGSWLRNQCEKLEVLLTIFSF